MEEFIKNFFTWCKTKGIELLLVLFAFWLSFKIVNFIFKKLEKILSKKEVDETIKQTTLSFGRKGIKLVIFISLIAYLGVETSSIVAVLTSIGITVGLALQGSLSNFAGGVIILIMRPYKIGDFVEFAGSMGTVEKIQLFYTTIRTPDYKVIVIPNSKSGDSVIVNYSIKDRRRLDLTFTISSQNDFRKAKRIITNRVQKLGYALTEPAPLFVTVSKYSEHSMDILVRMWVKSSEYWDCNFATIESIKLAFDKYGIAVPHKKLDVYLKEKDEDVKPIDIEDKLVKEEIENYEKTKEEKKVKKQKALEEREKKKALEEKKLKNKIKRIIKID